MIVIRVERSRLVAIADLADRYEASSLAANLTRLLEATRDSVERLGRGSKL